MQRILYPSGHYWTLPLDVTVRSRRRGERTFRQGVVTHAPGAGRRAATTRARAGR